MYKNPITAISSVGTPYVPNYSTFGTHFSVYGVGGYMEVYKVSDLYYSIPSGQYGPINYSGNTIPVNYTKSSGGSSFDSLILNSDNISSGRRRLGMLVYVYETDQIYQFSINNYDTLWSSATASTNCVTIGTFGTIVRGNTPEGITFISSWTGNTVEGISGATSSTAVWKKLATGGGGGGSGITGGTYYPNTLTLDLESTGSTISIGNVTGLYISAGTYTSGTSTLNLFNSTGGTISVTGITAGSGGGGSSNFQYFISGSSPTGTINNGDRWFYTESGEEFVWITDQDGSQWVQPVSISYGVSEEFVHITGDTMTGTLYVPTISATTYQNLPTDIKVTGATYSNNTFTYTNNTGGTFSVLFNTVTGLTVNGILTVTGNTSLQNLTASTISATTYYNLPSISGLYLPLSGGTLTGGLVANSGVTASTISQTSYIDFTTGSTNPSQTGGRVFFDNDSKALSYYGVDNDLLPIAMGQQLYTRVWNATGAQIDKGKVIAITGTSNSLPSAILAVNNHSLGSPRPIGLAAENIPNGTEGLVITNGILSGITLNTFANGATLYLSDTIPGGYVDSTSSLSFSARTNEIGYVLQTGSTTGKIYVNINNEDSNLTLTDIERNILEGNVISSGVYEYTGMTQGTGATINVAMVRGWIVKNTYGFATLPDVTNLYYTGGTNIPLTNLATADATFILINSASTLVQQTTFPTPQERRENIFLGKVVHPSRTSITSINQTVDFDVSPMAALRDLWTPLKLINQGVLISANGVNMNINTSSGTLWGNGIGWTTNQQNPDSVTISGTSPTTFQYRTQLGPLTGGSVTTGNTTTIEPGYYDLNGVVTAVGGGSNSSTNQRVFLFPTGLVRIQLGQTVYSSLSAAVAGSQTEAFTEYSLNRENGILIGIISLNKNASVGNGGLVNTNYAVFNLVSKFGEVLGGTGGLSTTTLQQAYDNSTEPEILINSTLNGVSIRNGTGGADNVTSLLQGQNTAGTTTSFIRADGAFSGTSIYGTGLSATTISATTYQNLPGSSASNCQTTFYVTNISGCSPVNMLTEVKMISGLTVTGAGYFTGTVTASTISATTYSNLPTDIRTTGGTYSNNTFTFTNNTGGTYSVLFNTVTGLTVNGELTITGNTSAQGLTATTISATTYQNLPSQSGTGVSSLSYASTTGVLTLTKNDSTTLTAGTFTYLTGSSYSNNVVTFTNNLGSTSNITINTVTGLTVNGILTVTGNTSAQGLTATTISATTYQNLPTDVRVTGATYSNNTFTYTNNTGGTFSVLFNTLTGLTVNGNISTTGVTTFGNGTFTKTGFNTGDVLLDNNGTDTPGVLFYYANNSNYGIDSWNGSFDVLSGQLFRVTNKLNETGGAVKMAVDTSGNLVMTGFIKANAWRAGQVVNDIMLSNTEVTISTTTIATSNSDTDFLTYSYTPLSTSSYIVIHYHLASYSFEGGTGNDSYFSRIKVDGNEITYSRQSTVNGPRTGVLFPLTGRYTNSNTTAKSIVVACRRDSADDNITIVNTATSMWLRITEIAR